MAKLLHFEFHKLIRQKSFYICLAVAVAMLVVSTCTTYLINKDVMDTAEMGIDAMNVMIGSASGGVLSMVIGVFIPLFRLRGLRFRHDTQHRNARLLAPRYLFGKAYSRNACDRRNDDSMHGRRVPDRSYILRLRR